MACPLSYLCPIAGCAWSRQTTIPCIRPNEGGSMQQLWARTLLSIAAATIVVATAQAQTMKLSGDVVKIGVLSDMSGLYSDLGGQGSVVATEMAVEDFKAQYKPTYKIE